ncbi:site-specific integrase [Streptomyces olivaceoviridis]|uniref:integrase n=1 Tax=Streptomyces olivaceoviridis TaxID=1921 RepID=UPI0036F6E746
MNEFAPAVRPERAALIQKWAERHGIDAAQRLAQAEHLADAVAEAITPANTTDTYAKSWRVWERFCETQEFPLLEASRGALVTYAAWMLREGQQDGTGYAPATAKTHLAATTVGLRQRGVTVSKDATSEARTAIEGLAVKLLKAGERRGRGKAVAADVDGLHLIVRACPPTLTGLRDKALILTGFNFASRASEPAGLLLGDVSLHPRGMVVSVLTGKTTYSVREAKIPYAQDPEVCPVRAWTAYRTQLVAEHGHRWTDLSTPAFVGINRWGQVTGGMGPDSVTRAIKRISVRAQVPIVWTGHSLRSGLATEGRKKGKDAVSISRQGGWAPNSREMLGYMRAADEWDDNAAAGLT